jgi:hypothetical protein
VTLFFGGRVLNLMGSEFFAAVMSYPVLFLAFVVPEGQYILFVASLCFAFFFLCQFLIFSINRTTMLYWTVALIVIVSSLGVLQAIFGWRFAILYYGTGVTVFCLAQSVAIVAGLWVASYRAIKFGTEPMLYCLNIFLFCGLAWGAIPYLGELP